MFLSVSETVKGWFSMIWSWLYGFFTPDLSGYTNFDFGEGTMLDIRVVIFGIFIGVLMAALYIIYIKNVVGAFVRKLLAEGCLSEETAKTAEELGYGKNPLIRSALRGTMTRGTVYSVLPKAEQGSEPADGEDKPKDKLPTFAETRFYIPEDKKYAAEMRFNARGSGWPTFFVVLVLSIACIFLIFAILPHALNYLDKTISIFSVEGNTVR